MSTFSMCDPNLHSNMKKLRIGGSMGSHLDPYLWSETEIGSGGYKLIAWWEGKAGLIEAKHTTYLRTCVLENVWTGNVVWRDGEQSGEECGAWLALVVRWTEDLHCIRGRACCSRKCGWQSVVGEKFGDAALLMWMVSRLPTHPPLHCSGWATVSHQDSAHIIWQVCIIISILHWFFPSVNLHFLVVNAQHNLFCWVLQLDSLALSTPLLCQKGLAKGKHTRDPCPWPHGSTAKFPHPYSHLRKWMVFPFNKFEATICCRVHAKFMIWKVALSHNWVCTF